MSEIGQRPEPKRADAERNRADVLDAARIAFAERGPDVSMAELARRAHVGRATVYRNFPTRRDLLEAMYVGEVDAMCNATASLSADTPGSLMLLWLHRFFEFFRNKHDVGELIKSITPGKSPAVLFSTSRDRVLAAGQPLLVSAQMSGEIRADVTLEQALDVIIAVGTINREPEYVAAVLGIALDGLRTNGPSDTREAAVAGRSSRPSRGTRRTPPATSPSGARARRV